jgi:Amt family ammonium transporter
VRFSFVVLFSAAWLVIVYCPVAHWVWSGGWLAARGTVDFAGGIVVHTTAGVSALVAAMMIGRRRGFPNHLVPPHSPGLTMTGAGMLWVGWFGFNGGSALQAGSRAAFAIVATHLAASAGALTWSACEWASRGKPSVLGLISGAVAGLGAITPASGFVLPWQGVVIGVLAGGLCYWACTALKQRLGYDDSLDVFGVHGVGGSLGTLLTGVFAAASVSAAAGQPGVAGLIEGHPSQLLSQAIGVVATALWCAVGTWAILKVVDALVGLRVTPEQEREGLDLALHGETVGI